MTTNDSKRYILLSGQERHLLTRAARGVSEALGAVPGSARVWGPFADAARTLEQQVIDGTPVTDTAVDRAARRLNAMGWTCSEGADEPGQYDTCASCRGVAQTMARRALEAAFGGGSK